MGQIKRANTWRDALRVLEEIEENGQEPNLFHFSAVINKCAKGRQWKKAIQLLREMEERGIQPNVNQLQCGHQCL